MSTPRQFSAQLRSWNKQLPSKVVLATSKAVIDTANGAKVRAPVDTGNLRDSIKYRWEVNGTHITAEAYAGAEYAWFVENGTSVMAAQPYMGPSFERNSAKWLKAMQRLGAMEG